MLVRALQLWSLWWEILPGGFRVPAYRTTRNALLVFPCSLGLTDALKARELIKGCTARNYLGALEGRSSSLALSSWTPRMISSMQGRGWLGKRVSVGIGCNESQR